MSFKAGQAIGSKKYMVHDHFVQAQCGTRYFFDPMAHTALDDTITAFKSYHDMDDVSDCWQYRVTECTVPFNGISCGSWAAWLGTMWLHFMCHEAQPADFPQRFMQCVYVPPDPASLRSD